MENLINNVYHEPNLETMKRMQDNSIDAIVTDPPYGLAFMGKKWDYDVPSIEIWQECLRVLKPGGHLLAFAGTRTQHRMAVRIEDAGFEIRDMIMWVYGQGFSKSHNISKAIDKAAGAEREVVGISPSSRPNHQKGNTGMQRLLNNDNPHQQAMLTAPATPEAQQWDGWGTALKPAVETITVARKPLQGTVAENVLTWGTGGINIDGCRIGAEQRPVMVRTKTVVAPKSMSGASTGATSSGELTNLGRFPANLIHDGSEEVVGMFPETASGTGSIRKKAKGLFGLGGDGEHNIEYGDSGSAARFFYQAKADKGERGQGNTHPTVKPIDLMRYLCRLVTPPSGVVYDPFTGSGTTLIAAHEEGFNWIGSEMTKEYWDIAVQRIKAHTAQQKLF
jgi:site-specific DNA-methyltransferase (adenine-specific)